MSSTTSGAIPRVILCRFGELFLKSGNRKRFEATLHRNMAAAVANPPPEWPQMPIRSISM